MVPAPVPINVWTIPQLGPGLEVGYNAVMPPTFAAPDVLLAPWMNIDLATGTVVDAVFVSGVVVLSAVNDVVLDPSVSVVAAP